MMVLSPVPVPDGVNALPAEERNSAGKGSSPAGPARNGQICQGITRQEGGHRTHSCSDAAGTTDV
jgi:hypothetical protein